VTPAGATPSPSTTVGPDEVCRQVLDLLEVMAILPYLGEPVDQRAHALQAARHAMVAGADDELVAAAALHDIARAPAVHRELPGPHAAAGAAWCAPRFGPRVAWLVGSHVAAKRWMVATDPAYASTLSEASVQSLRRQGGPMAPGERDRFGSHRWAADAVSLRRWDDLAKVPGAPEADPGLLASVLERVAGKVGAW
jgi:predicted HD phosphohydrolase